MHDAALSSGAMARVRKGRAFIVLLMPVVGILLVLNLAEFWGLAPRMADRGVLAWLGLPPASWESIRLLLLIAFFGGVLHRYFRFIEKSFAVSSGGGDV
ncbi:hypothetical protein [Nitrospirillum amazonense]|uniref:Uncharacterized protein n=1 Tax=Nitrospirillum amazonense TaxID=28077 RepID=A0A560KLT6_9PROT|nr:hypothetical protein [Nitrospirillum amazonense]MDG3444343.1 hypothetical protein [Nitrospirillum amazonense]TWB83054.1 hypothetical protein FBZ87_101767 [Nitrospirillum amazonense]